MPQSSHPIVGQIPSLRRYARALMGGHVDDADDLVQDTLERAFAKWHLFRAGMAIRPWLFSIMHNVFVNQTAGRRNRQAALSLEDINEPGQACGHDEKMQVRDVSAAVAHLPAGLREVLLLVTIEDLSYADTARALDIPIGTVMSRLARARAQIREIMDGGVRAGRALLRPVTR